MEMTTILDHSAFGMAQIFKLPDEVELTGKLGVVFIIASITFFHTVNRYVGSLNISTTNAWKFQNLSTSCIHAFISGVWAFTCFLSYPEMMKDLLMFQNLPVFLLASFTTGYFIFDTMDIVCSGKLKECWEVFLHHIPVCLSLLYNVVNVWSMGYNCTVLLLEVNSVFLHLRKLLQMVGCQNYTLHRVNAVLNVATFVAFRLCALGFCTWGIYADAHRISVTNFYLMGSCFFVVDLINLVLLFRLVKHDFLCRRSYRSPGVAGGALKHLNNNQCG